MRYSAFISYNHRDREWANWLHRELERYRIPNMLVGRDSPIGVLGKRLPPVFQDREELAASADLAASVRDALTQSSSLVVICSSNGARSRWVDEEVRFFIQAGRRDRIQCLICPEDDKVDRAPEQIFPPALYDGVEPLAADARASGDGPRSALLKIIAGVIGVRYDELRRRDQARRQRRLAIIAGISAAGFVATSGLAAFAFVSRAEAVRERDIARQKTMTAQRTTEFVKGLFAVSEPSEAQGARVTALEVLDRGAHQIEGALKTEPNVKGEIMSTLGEVYLGLGSFRRADMLMRRSLAVPITEPETRARQLGVLSDSKFKQGDYAGAIAIFGEALAQLSQTEWMNAPSLYTRLLIGRAEALVSNERYADAEADIVTALRLDLQREGPRGTSVARDLETAGLARNFAGNLDAADRFYRQALAIRLPTQGVLHPRVSGDWNELGNIAYLKRDTSRAEQFWRRSLAADQLVLGPDHPDLAGTLNNLARVMVERQKFSEAKPLLQRVIAINLSQRDNTHDDLAFFFSNLALAEAGLGDLATAEKHFRDALASAELHKHRTLGPILTDLASVRCARGSPSEGLQMLARARPLTVRTYPDDPWRVAWVDSTRGICLLRAGDRAGAARLVKASAPAIAARWPVGTTFRAQLQRRLKAAAP